MEVTKVQAERLKNLINNWLNNADLELEATFGKKGTVDATTFLAVANRLRSRGFELIEQEPRMTIILPERIRFSLTGSGIIQQYCRDDTITGKPFIAIIKDNATQIQNIDLDEYNVRIKARREIELANNSEPVIKALSKWKTSNKAFRIIYRWSCIANGYRFDLSTIRSTFIDERGEFKWVKSFKDQRILSGQPTYEIEVELLHASELNIASAIKTLISGIGEVLKGLQKNNLLIKNSTKNKVFEDYKELTKTDRFRGVQPKTLEMQNFIEEYDESTHNIRKGYNVTDKADGLRTMGFCNTQGELYLIDNAFNIYSTGLKNIKCKNSLVDGEWITKDKNGDGIKQFLIFDIYYDTGGEKVSQLPFREIEGKEDDSRYRHLVNWDKNWNGETGPESFGANIRESSKLIIGLKSFLFGSPNNDSIFTAANNILNKEYIYHTDGLIFTSNYLPLPESAGVTFDAQFKWKPAEENTVDFLINIEKDPSQIDMDKIVTSIHPETGSIVRYKMMRLFVGSANDEYVLLNPRNTILYEQPLPGEEHKSKYDKDRKPKRNYRAVLFNPPDFSDTLASVCYNTLEIELGTSNEFMRTEVTNEPIYDKSIVEMRYDITKPSGWRWIPIRVRHDKTERLARGQIDRTLNSDRTANSVWKTIHDPITKYMITSGKEEPLEDEMKELRQKIDTTINKYYDKNASKDDLSLIRVLRDFHNKWIKNTILYKTVFKGKAKKLIDVACGKAGDLYKWIDGMKYMKERVHILGIDYSEDNIINQSDGAYKRYIESITDIGRDRVPKCLFVIGDSTKNWGSGEAGKTPEDADMLRFIFNRKIPEGPIPSYVEKNFIGAFRKGADAIACMFALHYMFENIDKLNAFINNIAENLAVGGMFIGACFDGDKLFNMLRRYKKGDVKTGKENDTLIWSITKLYDNDVFNPDETSVGLPINVQFMSIGAEHTEYLVSFNYLIKRLKEIGCIVLPDKEALQYGITSGTNMFEVSHKIAEKSGKKYDMPEAVKEYSFLNRWFIFKRIKLTEINSEDIIEDESDDSDIEISDMGVGTKTEVKKGLSEWTSQTVKSATQKIKENPSIISKADELIIESRQPIVDTVKDQSVRDKFPMIDEQKVFGQEVKTIPVTNEPPTNKVFTSTQIFKIGDSVPIKDALKIGEPDAGRYLSLISPTTIFDRIETDDGIKEIVYPTVEHYLAAMKYKHATNKPELAESLFSREGSIHKKFVGKRLNELGDKKKLISDRDYELLLEEIKEVRLSTTTSMFSTYGVQFDNNKWLTIKDRILRDALEQRYKYDKRFADIVQVAKSKNMYILFSSGDKGVNEYGGIHKRDGTISGANKVGRYIMEIAGFIPV
jgi:hypothetical protein